MSKYEEDTKLFNERTHSKTTCECGHRVLISNKKDRQICSWCGKYVFKNKQAEFRYKFKENLVKEKRKIK